MMIRSLVFAVVLGIPSLAMAQGSPAVLPGPTGSPSAMSHREAPRSVPGGFEGAAAFNFGVWMPERGPALATQVSGRLQLGYRILPFLGVGGRAEYGQFTSIDGMSLGRLAVHRVSVGSYAELHVGPAMRHPWFDPMLGIGLEASTLLVSSNGQLGHITSIGIPLKTGLNIWITPNFGITVYNDLTPYIPIACGSGHCGSVMGFWNAGVGVTWVSSVTPR